MATELVKKYEDSFARLFGAKKAFAFWKGRVGLYAILKALGIGDDDEVILPGYTCVMDVNPVKYLGARPVFVDIEPNTYNMNVELLEETITSRTKAIIAQHTYGYMVEMDTVTDIAKSHDIPVIEDCCLALGSRYKGRQAGKFGVAAYFSSQWNKTYTTGIGGMAICYDDNLADSIQQICENELRKVPLGKSTLLSIQRLAYRALVYPRTTPAARRFFRWLISKGVAIGSSSVEEKEKTEMREDFFMGMGSGQAGSGIRQLGRLEKNIAHRKKMAKLYDKLLSRRGWLITKVPKYTEPVLVRYPVRVADKWQTAEGAIKHGIELGTWFESPLHPEETNVWLYDYCWGMCPEAEKAANEVVNLPLHPRTSEKTVRRTVDFITQYKPAE